MGDLPDVHKSQKEQWTVILDFPSVFGSPDTVQKLDQLASQDEKQFGKSVSIIGQTVNFDQDGQPFLRRFEYANGQLSSLGDANAQDMGSDLEDLLRLAEQRHPKSKTALIFDSHGLGQFGLVGDQGRLSLPKLELAISKGLGRKVDLLDLDACEMGQVGPIRSLKKSAKHLIASAEYEQGQGQNLPNNLNAFIENPDIDPSEAADEIVKRSGEFTESGGQGVHTLAHFDLKYVPAFDRALNNLGSALTMAMKDRQNAESIRKVIENIPAYDAENSFEKRDLKLFTASLNEAIQKGEISDKTGKLGAAIKRVTAVQSKLVSSYFGDDAGDLPYDRMGGLSVFLPAGTIHNKEQLAKDATETQACKDVYALAKNPELFAPYKNERDIAVCMTAAPMVNPEKPPSELAHDQVQFNRALDKFVQKESDNKTGAWANFVRGLLQ